MIIVKLTKDFQARLRSLKNSGKKQQYQQAQVILNELQMEERISKSLRPDSRLPNGLKYELPNSYRIVFQKIDGSDNSILALCVGSHDEVDRYLDNHKGWIFDPETHTLRELRFMTVEVEQENIVRSPELKTSVGEGTYNPENVFGELNKEHLKNSGMPENKIQEGLSLSDPDSIEVMNFLDSLAPRTADMLLSYITGSDEVKTEICLLLEGKREFHTHTKSVHSEALETNSNIFIDLRDLPEEKVAFDSYSFEDWMLFLHPDQKPIVSKEFKGPARLRGVSGSGKTIVAIHRVRHFARKIIDEGTNEYALFVTLNRSLVELVRGLLDKLCLKKELEVIEVLTIDKWCSSYIDFQGMRLPRWQEPVLETTWYDSVREYFDALVGVGLCKPMRNRLDSNLTREVEIQYLRDEIDFIYGKFVHANSQEYLDCDRAGRVKRLIKKQREVVLSLYKTYAERLLKQKQYFSKEINRIAYATLKQGDPPQKDYRAIIVDEVQDFSEIELGVLNELAGGKGGKLFFVGDGAQKIYTRGFSMKNLGIMVAGRSFVLKQNYRNTKEITQVASLLMKSQEIGKYDDDPETSQMLAKNSSHSSEKPLLIVASNPKEEWGVIVKEIVYLTKRMNIKLHEICCMARAGWVRKGLKIALEEYGFQTIEYKADGIVANDCIKISSLHNSKGHEFKVVFIAGLFDGAIPLMEHVEEPENLEKEAALFYVAITRAKNLLYFSYSKSDEMGRPLSQSRFIDSIQNEIDIINC